MIGAIIGDIAGSFREFSRSKKYPELGLIPDQENLPLNSQGHALRMDVTDDSVLTCATMKAIGLAAYNHRNTKIDDFTKYYQEFGNEFYDPVGGYGGSFRQWLNTNSDEPYNSCGNGSAMRVSPVGWIAQTDDECRLMAFHSASATHNHPEGIKGAQATALAIFYARQGFTWHSIKEELDLQFLGYEPCDGFDHFDAICQETMRLVWHCLDTTTNFHDAVLKAVTIPNADSDTVGAIVGSIAEALYAIPDEYVQIAKEYLARYPTLMNEYQRFLDLGPSAPFAKKLAPNDPDQMILL